MAKVIVINTISLSNEEKEILRKAKDILLDVSNQLDDEPIDTYDNSEYITDIIDINFCY